MKSKAWVTPCSPKGDMPPEAEHHHMNGGLGVTGPQAAERCEESSEDLICGSGVLVAPAAGQMRRRIGQIQIRRRAGKQVQRQGRMAVGG